MILTLDSEGQTPEEIAAATNRSPATTLRLVTRNREPGLEVVPTRPVPAQAPSSQKSDLDQVVDFLAQFPEDVLQEIIAIASVTRQQKTLLRQLQSRLAARPIAGA